MEYVQECNKTDTIINLNTNQEASDMFNNSGYFPEFNENSTENESPLMTPNELAQYLGIGRNRAYDLLREDTIHGIRIGKTWKVSREAVDAFIRHESKLPVSI